MERRFSFCVVVPMYNEEAAAEKCVRSVCQVLVEQSCRTGLIVVDDGSQDRTGSILKGLAHDYPPLVVVTHKKNKGYGAALKTGTDHAAKLGFEYILFMDSDLTNNPKDIPKFVAKMLEGYDVIKASRYCKGGAVSGVPAYRVFISVVGNRIAGFLYGLPLSDCTNGFRAVKVDVLCKMTLTEPAFPVIMEELYYAKFVAKSFCEIPSMLTNRTGEQRATSFRYRPAVFYRYLKYAIKSFLHIKPSPLRAVLNS